jgi:nicotinate-nucleotide adenylyltransferase
MREAENIGRRLGVLGGTFDPPHIGHLILGEVAREALGLEKVLFVPAADPPHKVQRAITQLEHRLAMLEAAIAGNPAFAVSYADINRPGPHYTVDMLRVIREEYQGKDGRAPDLYFLLGGDSLRDFVTWRDPAGILRQARLGVMRRPGAVIDLSDMAAKVPALPSRITFIDAPVIGVSSTELRAHIGAGGSARYQVPPEVLTYIRAHGVYQARLS